MPLLWKGKHMKINVPLDWGMGRSKRVRPGDYDIDDPALLGYGQYLVDNGHATVIEEDKPKKPEVKAAKRPERKTARKVMEGVEPDAEL